MFKSASRIIAILASMWLSLIAAAVAICLNIYKIVMKVKTKEKYFKNIIITLLSGGYIALFLWMGYENFKILFGVIVIICAIISTQLQKYEDRKSGKRWWTH